MELKFQKISGAKNTFLIRGPLEHKPQSMASFVKKICDPFDGFCADGVVFVEPLSDAEYRWDFYNSDGSSAEMCGNAIRCAHEYIQQKFFPKTKAIMMNTVSGKVMSTYKDGFFYVQMPLPKEKNELFLTSEFFNNASLFREFENVSNGNAYFVDTGVPHLVIAIQEWAKALEQRAVWQFLRNHDYFRKGTNVTLVQSQKNGNALAITFERGVDDFTQACGTGAVAAAIYLSVLENLKIISLAMPGGNLRVDLTGSEPILIGQVIDVGHVIVEIKD